MKIEIENKLVAEFMGATPDAKGRYKIDQDEQQVIDLQSYTQGDDDYWFRFVEAGYIITHFLPREMRYHQSWDWLMPVIAKSNRIVKGKPLVVNFPPVGKKLQESILDNKIDVAFDCLVKFIEWYNQNIKL